MGAKKPLSSLYRRSGYGILRGFTLECVVVAAFYLSPMNQDEIKAAAKSLDVSAPIETDLAFWHPANEKQFLWNWSTSEQIGWVRVG